MKHLSKKDLSAFADGSLSDDLKSAHLKSCPVCRKEYDEIMRIKRCVKNFDPAAEVSVPEMKFELPEREHLSPFYRYTFNVAMVLVFILSVSLGIAGGKRISEDRARRQLLSRNEFNEMGSFYQEQVLRERIFGE